MLSNFFQLFLPRSGGASNETGEANEQKSVNSAGMVLKNNEPSSSYLLEAVPGKPSPYPFHSMHFQGSRPQRVQSSNANEAYMETLNNSNEQSNVRYSMNAVNKQELLSKKTERFFIAPINYTGMDVENYNGGARGSTRDKKRFFETIVTNTNKRDWRAQSQISELLYQKLGSIHCDQNTASGYDSVEGDFAGSCDSTDTVETSRNSSPTLIEDSSTTPVADGEAKCSLQIAQGDQHMSQSKPPTNVFTFIPNDKTRFQPFSTYEMQQANHEIKDEWKPMLNGDLKEESTGNDITFSLNASTGPLLHYPKNSLPVVTSHSQEAPVKPKLIGGSSSLTPDSWSIPEVISRSLTPQSHKTNATESNKWLLRTDGRNNQLAQGVIEIPQRQSVATLREKIANQLQVRSPSVMGHSALPLNKSCHELQQKRENTVSNVLRSMSVGYEERNVSVSDENQTSAQLVQSCTYDMHEPAIRHLPRMTSVHFSKPTLSTVFSLQVPGNKEDSSRKIATECRKCLETQVTKFDVSKNSVYSNLSENDGSSDKWSGIASKLDVKTNGSDSAIDLTPTANSSSANSITSPSNTSVTSTQPEMPSFSTPLEPKLLNNSSSRNVKIANSSPMNTSRSLIGEISHRMDDRKSNLSMKSDSDRSEASQWYRSMFDKMHRMEKTVNLHRMMQLNSTENFNSNDSTMEKSFLELQAPARNDDIKRSRTPSSYSSYTPFDACYKPRRCKSVGRFVDSVQNHNVVRQQANHSYTPTLVRPSSSRAINSNTEDNYSEQDGAKNWKKNEIINRAKIEKLSAELNEQKKRRTGYVPSATPSLLTSFDRFNSLMNNFGCDSKTPHQSSPVAVGTCTALYDFKGQGVRELSFNRGDVIRIHRTIDRNWMEGERNGQTGIFPSSYAQINSCTNENVRLIANFPFQARNTNELSLKKDDIIEFRRTIDAYWFEGVSESGQIGIFPKSYVRAATDNSLGLQTIGSDRQPNRPVTPKFQSSNTDIRKTSNEELQERALNLQKLPFRESTSELTHATVAANAERYRALYDYQPLKADELELYENDIIVVVEKCDDGWFIGTKLNSNQFGTFPGNYVERC